jgi:molybdopterin-guanine dinucleotide biosynthesis protein A
MALQTKVTGVILAGGQARRMNFQDKGLQLFRGQILISYSFNALRPIVDELIINANQNLTAYENFGVPVISDLIQDFSGALAGILAAMTYSNAAVLLVVPCDAPFISTAQLQHLLSEHEKSGAEITVARTGEQIHSVFLVVKTSLQASLETYLAAGNHKVRLWFESHQTHFVDFGENARGFENINTLAELNAYDCATPK